MLEEALKIFNLKEICTLEELDNAYKTLIRKNYDENFPFHKEAGTMNVRLYEWSYQIILPFAFDHHSYVLFLEKKESYSILIARIALLRSGIRISSS